MLCFGIKPCHWKALKFLCTLQQVKWSEENRISLGWLENPTGSWGHFDGFLVPVDRPVASPNSRFRNPGQMCLDPRTTPLPTTHCQKLFFVLFHFLLNCCYKFASGKNTMFWNKTHITVSLPLAGWLLASHLFFQRSSLFSSVKISCWPKSPFGYWYDSTGTSNRNFWPTQ